MAIKIRAQHTNLTHRKTESQKYKIIFPKP